MLALDLLRVAFAWLMLSHIEMTGVGTLMVRVITLDPKRLQQFFQLQKHLILTTSKELMVFTLIYNCIRLVMSQAARRQQMAIERISLIDAMRWRRCKPTSRCRRWWPIPTVPVGTNPGCESDVRSPIR
jgi:hypothetical protein